MRFLSALLLLALLAIPAAAEDSADPGVTCTFAASSGSDDPFGTAPLWNELPDMGVQDPENAAVIKPAPLCPKFRPCSGTDCFETGTCSFTDTGQRCCYITPGQQTCCPAGQTVFQVNCACGGTSCNVATHQTALCF